jgi:hypothetical protein
MNWFQRYGIPGAIFWGLLILWIGAFYHSEIDKVLHSTQVYDVKVVGGIIVGSFLPIGYLISILGQLIYLACPCFGIHGVHMRARRLAGVKFGDNDTWWRRWEAKVEALTFLNVVAARQNRLELEQSRFIQEWNRHRVNVLAINWSLMLATVLSPLSVCIFIKVFDLTPQVNWNWFWFATIVSGFIFVVSLVSWLVLHYQVTKVIAGHFSLLVNGDLGRQDKIR